jgi:hypothetical protein
MGFKVRLMNFGTRLHSALGKVSRKLYFFFVELHSSVWAPYLIIAGFFIVAISSRLLFNGMVFRFDYGLYQPDGIHYSIRTFMLLGDSDFAAASKVSNWYLDHGTKVKILDPIDFIPQNNPAWPVIAPRVLYPVLSAPFVYLFGMQGMLVVPALSLLLTMFAVYYYAKKVKAPWVGFAIAVFISTSPTILRWVVSNCTDGLLMGIFAVAMVLLLQPVYSNFYSISLALTVAFSCLTRFCLPIWLILAALLFKTNKRNSILIAATAILFTAPTFTYRSESGKIPASDNFSSLEQVAMFPITFLKILFIEFAQLAALDRLLFIILVCAMLISIVNYSAMSSLFFAGVFLGVFTLGTINGVMGVNFRYQLPLIPFAAASIAAFASSILQKSTSRD